jgi:hypothetical protein
MLFAAISICARGNFCGFFAQILFLSREEQEGIFFIQFRRYPSSNKQCNSFKIFASFCFYGKRGRLIWAKVHRINSRTDDLERIGGNLHLRCISLSAEKEMREEVQRGKRKNPKNHLETSQTNRTVANLPKIHKTKPGILNRRIEVTFYPGTSGRMPESLLKAALHYFLK